jgi:hypothetical protein
VRKKQPRWRSWTALVAAYALALQTLFLALSYGAHANPAAVDTHVLCLPSGAAPDSPVQPGDTAHHLDCCVLGGNLFGKLLVPPQPEMLAVAHAQVAAPPITAAATPSLPRLRSPQMARGPPLA